MQKKQITQQIPVRFLFKNSTFILVLLFILGFAIRILRLDFHSLWYDEATTVYLMQHETVGETVTAVIKTTGSETLHPLFYVILAVWTHLAGFSEWALRLPSVIFGAAAVIVFFLIFYDICGKKSLILDGLLIISPFLIWYARDARPYSLIMFTSGFHLLFFLKILRNSHSKTLLFPFILTGALMIYSGILTEMLLAGEFIWFVIVKQINRMRNVLAVTVVIILSLPLVWHGWQTHFSESSGRYQKLPTGVTIARIVSIPQEFFIGRSFGPTPDEIRRFSFKEVLQKKTGEIIAEVSALMFILLSIIATLKYLKKFIKNPEMNYFAVYALGFVVISCILQIIVLILFVHYTINARHIAFLFGPLFNLAVLPIVISEKFWPKLTFVLPILLLWTWSCSNQLFNSSYTTEDYRSAAGIINNDKNINTGIMALCHPNALHYYGVDRELNYIPESPNVTIMAIKEYLRKRQSPMWLVLARPWKYPQLRYKELTVDFKILREEHLPGIDMWLLKPE